MTTPLHAIGDFFRELLAAIPLPVARGLFVLIPAALLVWVLCLPKSETTRTGSETRRDENLKVWAGLALAIQIAIYALV